MVAFARSFYDFFTVDGTPNGESSAVFTAIGLQMVLLMAFVIIETARVGGPISRPGWFFTFAMGVALAVATPAFFASHIRTLLPPVSTRPPWIKAVWAALLAISIHQAVTLQPPGISSWSTVSLTWASSSLALDLVFTSVSMALLAAFVAIDRGWSIASLGLAGVGLAAAAWHAGGGAVPAGLPGAGFAAFALTREFL